MTITFSLYGVIALLLMTLAAMGCAVMTDRRMSVRYQRAAVVNVVQVVVAGLLFWGAYRLNSLWADLLWWLVLVVLSTLAVQHRLRSQNLGLLLSVGVALLTATMVVGAVLLSAVSAGSGFFSFHLFIPLSTILTLHAALSLYKGMQAYLFSLRHTIAHRQYLLANGATHIESVMPSARRAMRAALLLVVHRLSSPSLLFVPVLLAGMLMGGVRPLAALCVSLLLLAACLASTVVAMLLLLRLSDRWLFDKHEQLLA